MPKLSRFASYAWGVLAYNLLVIMWGAYVRASGSGAGCGEHWPVCNGQVIPRAPQIETIVEFSHRLTTGLAGLLVIGLVVGAWRMFPRGHRVRWGAALTLFFIILEGAVGAVQVKLGLVADDQSRSRAVISSIHLTNTFLLTGAMALTAWWASGGQPLRLRGQGWINVAFAFGLVGLLVISAFGAITALGDTLFPAATLREGLRQDIDPTAHFLIQLRVYHPVLATAMSLFTMYLGWLARTLRPSRATRLLSYAFVGLFIAQLGVGLVNVLLLVPIWTQLLHLLMADLVWLAMVLLAASALSQPAPALVPAPGAQPAASSR